MADLMTMIEYHGPLAGQSVAWLGDGNNVAASWIEAAVRFGFQLRIAGPQNYAPPADLLAWALVKWWRYPPYQRGWYGH
jgi:ornithine carbamoyltransferase